MNEYHKIQTVYKRDMNTHRLIEGEFSMEEFGYLKDLAWMGTEKVDGTNVRVKWDGTTVTLGGKTDSASFPTFLMNQLLSMFGGSAAHAKFSETFGTEGNVCLYGEGYGAKIQKGGGNYKSDGTDFVLFDIKIGGMWLNRVDVMGIAEKLGIKIVPSVGFMTLGQMVEFARGGFKSFWGDFEAEGIVARPICELRTRRGDRIITKIKCRDFK